jgi:3-hydroxyisobutyrate dehydrogenase-like beta-hydroxyacid dehydrogenase
MECGMTRAPRIALIGYGEVGRILAEDLRARGCAMPRAWDILFTRPDSAPARALGAGHVEAARSAADAVADASIVISAVTAGQCVEAARTAGPHLARNAHFVDLNSVAPRTKIEASHCVEANAARYIEAAVMAPIGPKRIAAPMLLGGPHAADFLPLAQSLGFSGMRLYSELIGRASAAKMCRSVMVKGIEALLAESLIAARHYGVEDDVLASLEDLLPVGDWRRISRYMISRSLQHGARRAQEMREVAKTVADAHLDPWMSEACALRQDWAAEHAGALMHEPLEQMLDALAREREQPAGVMSK